MDHAKEMSKKAFYILVSLYLLAGFILLGIGDCFLRYFYRVVHPVPFYGAAILAITINVCGIAIMRNHKTLAITSIGYGLICISLALMAPFVSLPVGTLCAAMSVLVIFTMLLLNVADLPPWIIPPIHSLLTSLLVYVDNGHISDQILKRGQMAEVAIWLSMGLLLSLAYWLCRKAKRTHINAVIGAAGLPFLFQE